MSKKRSRDRPAERVRAADVFAACWMLEDMEKVEKEKARVEDE